MVSNIACDGLIFFGWNLLWSKTRLFKKMPIFRQTIPIKAMDIHKSLNEKLRTAPPNLWFKPRPLIFNRHSKKSFFDPLALNRFPNVFLRCTFWFFRKINVRVCRPYSFPIIFVQFWVSQLRLLGVFRQFLFLLRSTTVTIFCVYKLSDSIKCINFLFTKNFIWIAKLDL